MAKKRYILEPHDFQKWVWETVSICILQLWEDRATLRLTVYGQLRHFSHIFTRFTPGCFWKEKTMPHPQEQMPIAFNPLLIFCPSDTRNCPSLTASPTCSKNLAGQNILYFVNFIRLLWRANGSSDHKDEVTCVAFVFRLTSFMTPVFVPPDKTQAFVALTNVVKV